MRIRKPNIRYAVRALLLAVFVLSAQTSALAHDLEHFTHGDAQESCQAFIGFEKSSLETSAVAVLPIIKCSLQRVALNPEDELFSTSRPYLIRAPPSLV